MVDFKRTETFSFLLSAVTIIAFIFSALALLIQKRGTLAGTVRNLFSASPRFVVSGSMKTTALAPSMAALIQRVLELKSTKTTLPSGIKILDSEAAMNSPFSSICPSISLSLPSVLSPGISSMIPLPLLSILSFAHIEISESRGISPYSSICRSSLLSTPSSVFCRESFRISSVIAPTPT